MPRVELRHFSGQFSIWGMNTALVLIMLPLEVDRRKIAQRGMPTMQIATTLGELEDGKLRLGTQFGVDARGAVGTARARVDRPDLLNQLGISPRPGRLGTLQPRIKPAR